MNTSKSGIFAKNAVVLSTEDRAGLDEHLEDYIRRMTPACPVELRLVHEIASIDWRLARVLDCSGVRSSQLTPTAVAASTLVERSRFPENLARRESQLLKARETTLRTLHQIRKQYSLVDPSKEIRSPQSLDPGIDLQNEPESNPKRTQNEPGTNLNEPESNLTQPKAA